MRYVTGSDAHGGLSELTLWADDAHGLRRVAALDLESPSWVVPHPRLPLVYVTRESDRGQIVVVAIAGDGSLSERQRVDSHGSLPCHVTIDAAGTTLVASNYLGASVAAFSLTADGVIDSPASVWHLEGSGPVADRQEAPHAHMAVIEQGVIRVADLGSDRILRLVRGDAPRTELELPGGFGPRHFAMIGADRAVIVGELSAEIALVEWGANARILDVAPLTRRRGAQPSGIAVLGQGEVVVANRGVGSVSTIAVEGDHLIVRAETDVPGENPRAITADGGRTFVCLQDFGVIATYSGALSGEPRLTPAEHVSAFAALP